jgi:hypothetical protein
VLGDANDHDVAEHTREHLERAGCKRSRLYLRGGAQRRVQFRSWRDAGITWSIVAGIDVLKVQRRAGHKLISTTQRYIIEAENRGATFGEPFLGAPRGFVGGTEKTTTGGAESSLGLGQRLGQIGGRPAKLSD